MNLEELDKVAEGNPSGMVSNGQTICRSIKAIALDIKDFFVDCDCDHVWVECSRRPVYGKDSMTKVSYACDKCGRIKSVEEPGQGK